MRAVLPDTSVWSRREQPSVGLALSAAIEQDRVVMTTPIALELLRSARDAFAARALVGQLELLRWIPLSIVIERRAREIVLALTRRGYHRGPSAVDLIAAAAAEAAGAELWHCDRHFELIAEVTGQAMRRVGT